MAGVVHFEIHAADPQRAMTFYASVFGWEFQPYMEDYWGIITRPEGETGINGGLLRRRSPAPVSGAPVNAFVCTVEVDDLDATLARALEGGGELAVPTMPIEGVGMLAYVIDTEGNIVGALQPEAPAA